MYPSANRRCENFYSETKRACRDEPYQDRSSSFRFLRASVSADPEAIAGDLKEREKEKESVSQCDLEGAHTHCRHRNRFRDTVARVYAHTRDSGYERRCGPPTGEGEKVSVLREAGHARTPLVSSFAPTRATVYIRLRKSSCVVIEARLRARSRATRRIGRS